MTRPLAQLAAYSVALSAALATLAAFTAPVLYATPAAAQTAVAAQAPAINYRERPRYPFDPQRLKRRPVIDGKISDGEWDPLYTVSDGPVKGTVYLNWDDDYLYIAARTDQPAWLVFDLDSNDDGWLRGADNLELTVSPPTMDGSVALSARVLDAAGSKDAPVWNEKVVDTRSIQIVQKSAGGQSTVEMAIPKGIAGLSLRPGGALGFRADFLPAIAQPTPTAAYEPHLLLDVTLVEARTVSTPGLTPRLTLDDSKLVPGQTLRATIELNNQTEADVRVKSLAWHGEGAAADLLRSERDPNVPDIKGLKSLKRKYSSALPDDAVPGFYQLTATAELEDGRTVQSTTSFSVVEPFTLSITSDPDPVNVVGPTQAKLIVDIQSAVPGYARGDVELEAPAGWEVKGKTRKEFYVTREDSGTKAPFYLTIPSSTPAGDYQASATIYWRGKTFKTHTTVRVHNAQASKP